MRKSSGNSTRSLKTALSSLGELSAVIEHLETGESASKIAAHLSTILNAVRHGQRNQRSSGDIDVHVTALKHQLARTRCIKLNVAFPQREVALLSKESSKVSGARIGDWQISLTSNVAERQRHYSSQRYSVLYAQPLRNSVGSPLAALFSETTNFDCVSSAHPVVLAYEDINPLYRHILGCKPIHRQSKSVASSLTQPGDTWTTPGVTWEVTISSMANDLDSISSFIWLQAEQKL